MFLASLGTEAKIVQMTRVKFYHSEIIPVIERRPVHVARDHSVF